MEQLSLLYFNKGFSKSFIRRVSWSVRLVGLSHAYFFSQQHERERCVVKATSPSAVSTDPMTKHKPTGASLIL